jgi:uroporphyrinogen decarboxylase
MMFKRPDLWHKLMDKIVQFTVGYLNAQVNAGAQALQLFDSWVGSLAPRDYQEFVLPYSKKLIAGLIPDVPVIHFATGSATLLPLMKEAGGDVIGLDWRVDLASAWAQLGDVAVQGNLDPCVLLADKELIKSRCQAILSSVDSKTGHIFNLGHGVLPPTSVDNVKYLIDCVHSYRQTVK